MELFIMVLVKGNSANLTWSSGMTANFKNKITSLTTPVIALISRDLYYTADKTARCPTVWCKLFLGDR